MIKKTDYSKEIFWVLLALVCLKVFEFFSGL